MRYPRLNTVPYIHPHLHAREEEVRAMQCNAMQENIMAAHTEFYIVGSAPGT
jgi:hypothetical protein